MKNYNEMAESVIERRDRHAKERKKQMKRLTAAVSCFCLCAMLGIGAWQLGLFAEEPIQTVDDAVVPGIKDCFGPGEEYTGEQSYAYGIDEGEFADYFGGKVIAEEKIGAKINDITLTAGWKAAESGEWLTCEKLRGEIYSIEGIEKDIAVALKFTDKGEAVTLTHYYVIMNPNADLSAVEEYIISQESGDIAAE